MEFACPAWACWLGGPQGGQAGGDTPDWGPQPAGGAQWVGQKVECPSSFTVRSIWSIKAKGFAAHILSINLHCSQPEQMNTIRETD